MKTKLSDNDTKPKYKVVPLKVKTKADLVKETDVKKKKKAGKK